MQRLSASNWGGIKGCAAMAKVSTETDAFLRRHHSRLLDGFKGVPTLIFNISSSFLGMAIPGFSSHFMIWFDMFFFLPFSAWLGCLAHPLGSFPGLMSSGEFTLQNCPPGSPAYVAPEVVLQKPYASQRRRDARVSPKWLKVLGSEVWQVSWGT